MAERVPSDDLYARLGVPADADRPAIDRAWRTLLKQHHPDVAGAVSVELAKLINVAHDWLSDEARRARYDEVIHRREGRRATATARSASRGARPSATGQPPRRSSARPKTPPHSPPADDLDETFGASAPAIRSFLAQAAAASRDDLDRLSVSDAVDPVEELRDLVPPELWRRIEAIDARLLRVAPRVMLSDPNAATAARGYAHALVLELFLWYYLADPEPMLDGMRRGWESAVGLPRYGPDTADVTRLIRFLGAMRPQQAEALAAIWDGLGDREPWPGDAWEFDFAALEVSAALARRDAAAAADVLVARSGVPAEAAVLARWRAAFASTAHVLTLRPIFPPRAYLRYQRALELAGATAARRPSGPRPPATVRRA